MLPEAVFAFFLSRIHPVGEEIHPVGEEIHQVVGFCLFRVFFKLFHQNHDRFAAIVKRRIFEANRDK